MAEENEYFVAISIDNDVKDKRWFTSLIEAKKWADSYDACLNYTITIYKNEKEKPIIKYDKRSLF